MRNVALILIVFLSLACQPTNEDFNPFDNEFSLHRNFKLADYDTLMGECGYWNLTKRDSIQVYYQFFLDENPIVAKGFNYVIGEVIINTDSVNYHYLLDFIKNNSIDYVSTAKRLSAIGIKEVNPIDTVSDYMRVELLHNNGKNYYGYIASFANGGKITRQLSYFNGRD